MSIPQVYSQQLQNFIKSSSFRTFACENGVDVDATFTHRELDQFSERVTQYILTRLPFSPPISELEQYKKFTSSELANHVRVYTSILAGREPLYPAKVSLASLFKWW